MDLMTKSAFFMSAGSLLDGYSWIFMDFHGFFELTRSFLFLSFGANDVTIVLNPE
jgi:hypothetical protein